LASKLTKLYPTRDSVKPLIAKKEVLSKQVPPQVLAFDESIVVEEYLYTAGMPDGVWKSRLERSVAINLTPADQPTLAFWVDDFGWYSFAGNEPRKRLNNLVNATFTWWLTPTKDKSYLRLIYEYGQDKTDPTVTRNLFAATVGVDF